MAGPQHQGGGQSSSFILPRPLLPHHGQSATRPVGPCFQCGEVGHLKASCPHLSKLYPFDVNHNDDYKLLFTTCTGPQGCMVDQQVEPAEAGPSAKAKVVDRLSNSWGVNF